MRIWEELELPPDQFWSSTPRQISASMAARNAVRIREHNERAWLAYHTGGLARPLKKYPSLESMQIKTRAPRQTWQQQLAIAHMWASRNKGTMGRKRG